MKSNPQPSTQEVLAGLVERVTFHNAENGFCVLRAKAGERELVTLIGHAPTLVPASTSPHRANGSTSPTVSSSRLVSQDLATDSIDGIESYLGSGMIRGIGPVYAKKMVKAFGEKVFDIIEPNLIGFAR